MNQKKMHHFSRRTGNTSNAGIQCRYSTPNRHKKQSSERTCRQLNFKVSQILQTKSAHAYQNKQRSRLSLSRISFKTKPSQRNPQVFKQKDLKGSQFIVCKAKKFLRERDQNKKEAGFEWLDRAEIIKLPKRGGSRDSRDYFCIKIRKTNDEALLKAGECQTDQNK